MQTDRYRISRRALFATSALFALGHALPALARQDAAARLRQLLAASEAADLALDPIGDLRKGGDTAPGAPLFVNPLSDGYAARLEANKRADARALAAIPRDALTATDAIAYDVFAYKTAQQLELFDSGLFAVQRKAPLNPSFGMHVEFPDFMSSGAAPFATVKDYEDNLVRLKGFAGHLAMIVTRLRQGVADGYVQPRIIAENVLKQTDAMLAVPLAESPFLAGVRKFPDAVGAADRARLTAAYEAMVRGPVLGGYRTLGDYLRTTYLPLASATPGRAAMKDGARLYAWELARHTTTRRSADDIHALGLKEVAGILAQMEQVRETTGFDGDLKAFFEHVRTDPKYYYTKQEDLIARFEAIEAKIWPAIPKLFHSRPKAPFEVRPLPALGDQRGTGYYRAGPPDGVSPGILFFNMSMLNTRPIPTLETLTLHEGIPGHHFQITMVREDESLPPILRYGSATAYSEGWGLYAESLGPELGMFTDPMQLFGHLDMEMLRAVRLVVDTGIHAKGWERQKAIDYMLANTSMAPRDVAVEIDRYIAYPGQACAYKIGELKFRELREAAQAKLGSRFDVRDYHEQALSTGALPMDVLDAKIRRWIDAGGGRAA
ncbi:DUF885 domain-containing protein [Sphingomonas baiyangensis]|uniref:DUF885 domain-containing protein n=1 Tax=Sphingomonas baiyangensis TaxID=2572576 RepID=A0A4U1L1P8_9SPHN|nr:DUF885 domain-containing protein [Sphingomonas baiyangensis]TKD50749.1 DUF885 domain-containing protein [Sphingomonas baiyangensis]